VSITKVADGAIFSVTTQNGIVLSEPLYYLTKMAVVTRLIPDVKFHSLVARKFSPNPITKTKPIPNTNVNLNPNRTNPTKSY